jgi:hypothetical protein
MVMGIKEKMKRRRKKEMKGVAIAWEEMLKIMIEGIIGRQT